MAEKKLRRQIFSDNGTGHDANSDVPAVRKYFSKIYVSFSLHIKNIIARRCRG